MAKADKRNIASYADFVVTSFLYYIRRIDRNDFDGMIAIDSALSDIFEACEPWFLKDDYGQ